MKIKLLKIQDLKEINNLAMEVISIKGENFNLTDWKEYTKEDILKGFFLGIKDKGKLIATLYVKISFEEGEGISNYLNLKEIQPEIHFAFIHKDYNRWIHTQRLLKKAKKILKEHGFKLVYSSVNQKNLERLQNLLFINNKRMSSSIIKLTGENLEGIDNRQFIVKTILTKKPIPRKTKNYLILVNSDETKKINRFLNEGFQVIQVNKYSSEKEGFELILS